MQKSVVSKYIADALMHDFEECKNISETRVIQNLCKTYKILNLKLKKQLHKILACAFVIRTKI